MSTVTGTNNDVINAAVSVANPGAQITNAEQSATAQSIVNDLAAIRDSTTAGLPARVSRTGDTGLTGNYTTTGSFTALNITATGALAAGGNLGVSGDAAVTGNLIVNGNTTIGNATSDTATLTAATTVPAASTFNELGLMVEKAPAYISTANATIDLTTVNASSQKAQEIELLTKPSGTVTLTLAETGGNAPPDGFWYVITVLLDDSTNIVQIDRESASGSHIAILGSPGNVGTVEVASVKVKKVSGVWRGVWVGGKHAFHGGDW